MDGTASVRGPAPLVFLIIELVGVVSAFAAFIALECSGG
jgi:hypothetical protein